MATAKAAKTRKGGSAKKPVLTPKTPKAAKKPEKRKIQKKVVRKVSVMAQVTKPPKETFPPRPKDDKDDVRRTLMGMREKLLAGISENPVPEALITQTEIGDVIDQAGDERDRELSLLLSGRDKEKLLAINEALEKLREGTYGICEECGEKIGPGRIKVMPLAKFCVSCQAKLEKEMSLLRKADEDLTYRSLTYSSSEEEES